MNEFEGIKNILINEDLFHHSRMTCPHCGRETSLIAYVSNTKKLYGVGGSRALFNVCPKCEENIFDEIKADPGKDFQTLSHFYYDENSSVIQSAPGKKRFIAYFIILSFLEYKGSVSKPEVFGLYRKVFNSKAMGSVIRDLRKSLNIVYDSKGNICGIDYMTVEEACKFFKVKYIEPPF